MKHFENEIQNLKLCKPTKSKKLIEYREQKQIYLNYINIFKNYKNNTSLMNDVNDISTICMENCRYLYDQYNKYNVKFFADKVVIIDIIKYLNKTGFINTILTKLSPHFYKTHNNILEIIK